MLVIVEKCRISGENHRFPNGQNLSYPIAGQNEKICFGGYGIRCQLRPLGKDPRPIFVESVGSDDDILGQTVGIDDGGGVFQIFFRIGGTSSK